MAERAAHLVDHVFPAVPVRQWVLTFPHRLRYRLAWDHDLCRAVVGVAVRTVLGYMRHVARLTGVVDGRSGAVAIVQRFGGALNLNVHVHALVMDGVFGPAGEGVAFWPAPRCAASIAIVGGTANCRRTSRWRIWMWPKCSRPPCLASGACSPGTDWETATTG